MLEMIADFWSRYGMMLWEGTLATLEMTLSATVLAYVLGIPLGVLLVITQPHGIWPHRTFNSVVGWVVNIFRSMPFVILIIALIPFTRAVAGSIIGVKGAIIPLVIASAPFVARMVESSLSEVDGGVIEAVQSMGATVPQIVFKVYLPEAKPSLVMGASISLISILAYTAIAGMIGAGGLGDIAKRYGLDRGQTDVMWVTVVILIVVVQLIQSIFSLIPRRIDKRIRRQ